MTINQEADHAEHLIEMARREMVMHPRSPIVLTRETKEAIDLSGILALSEEQQRALLEEFEGVAA